MTGDIGLTGRIELSCLELLNHVLDRAGTSRDHSDIRSGKRLMSIRSAIAGQHELHTFFRQQLGRLDAGPSTERNIRVLDGFEFHGIRINDQEICTTAKPRVYNCIQRGSNGCNSDLHDKSSFPTTGHAEWMLTYRPVRLT